ncbi:hypothetical protein H9Q72_005356 [Fusarium xylarioides]|uniref:Carboxylesterase type B domain-containing protein n=1 Tax=Fusarium xylarioides TaxID=221167 RepID=A0A9P7I362_9HYPO|nr:hypothetical protein H9Q72_005356 [Fusarium xylarioides]
MKPLLSRLLLPIYVGAETPTATLDSGPIFGLTTTLPAASPVNKFLGIPFAAKPQRFSRATKPEPWTRPLNATRFGSSCRQLFVQSELTPEIDLLKGLFNTASGESEDCLFINAFAPADPHPSRAVLLFISGGGWQQGNGEIDLSGFAAYEDIVVFTFNYRTNVFGFPNSPDIPASETNLGIYDQELALEWVQRNARAFGGDPDKVTIWGESAHLTRDILRLKDFDTAAAIYTDFVWQCPQAILANISASINPTWRFYFNASVPSLLDDKYSWLGKFHGSDVLLLFSSPTFDAMPPQLYTFVEYFRGVVGRFVRNPQAGPGWPVGSRYVANLGDVGQTQTSGPSIIDQMALDQRCSLYESIYPLIEEYVLSV